MANWKAVAAAAISALAVVGIQGTLAAVSDAPTAAATAPAGAQPFQQWVSTSTNASFESCVDIRVPAGKRLVVQSLSVEALGTAAPKVYVKVKKQSSGSTEYLMTPAVPLSANGQLYWIGKADTTFYSGALMPDNNVFTYQACAVSTNNAYSSVKGIVVGYLESTA